MLERCTPYVLYLVSASNSKDPLAIQLEWRRSVGPWHDELIRRCIPCSIPDSLRGQANYMFRNGYNVRCCSRTLCSHPGRKSTNVLWSTAHDCPFPPVLPVPCPSSIASY